MKIQRNQLSMQVVLGKTKMSVDGKVPVCIRLTIGVRKKEIYLQIRIHPEQFDQDRQVVRRNCVGAQAINKRRKQSKDWLLSKWVEIRKLHGRSSTEIIEQFLDRLTLNQDSRESK
jgi:hypothetical protein